MNNINLRWFLTKEGMGALIVVIGFLLYAFTGQNIDPEVIQEAEKAREAAAAIVDNASPGPVSAPAEVTE